MEAKGVSKVCGTTGLWATFASAVVGPSVNCEGEWTYNIKRDEVKPSVKTKVFTAAAVCVVHTVFLYLNVFFMLPLFPVNSAVTPFLWSSCRSCPTYGQATCSCVFKFYTGALSRQALSRLHHNRLESMGLTWETWKTLWMCMLRGSFNRTETGLIMAEISKGPIKQAVSFLDSARRGTKCVESHTFWVKQH